MGIPPRCEPEQNEIQWAQGWRQSNLFDRSSVGFDEMSSVQEMDDKVYLTKLIPPNEYSDRSAYAPVSFIFLLS